MAGSPPASLTMRVLALVAAALVLAPGASALAHPGSGIAVDRGGRVYLVLFGSSDILRIDAEGRRSVFVSDDRIRIPHHLIMDAAGALYTASDDDGRIWRIAPDGRLTPVYAPAGPDAPRIGSGGDPFTIDAAGTVYFIREPGRDRIYRLTADGAEPFGDGTVRMGNLHGGSMAWGPDRSLYVTDRTRVHRIAPDGRTSAVLGGGELDLAMGVTVDAEGNVYVADYRGRDVVRLAPDGRTSSLGAGRLTRPSGVALGPGGALFVLDNTARGARVWRIGPDGSVTPVACIGPMGPVAEHAILVLVPLLLVGLMWVGRGRPLRDRVLRAFLGAVVMIPIYFFGSVGCASALVRYAGVAAVASAAIASFTTWRRTPRETGAPPSDQHR